jgi:DNA-binding response OmpR family regulator
MDGLAFLQRLRGDLRASVPVLVLSARTELDDKLAGFERGADDYMTKPFALAEVGARVRALLARAGSGSGVDPVLRFDALALDRERGEVRVSGTLVHLTPKAMQLLELLLRKPGQLLRRQDVEAALWPDAQPQADALRSQIHVLRKTLAEHGFDGVETVHGVGVRLVAQRREAG